MEAAREEGGSMNFKSSSSRKVGSSGGDEESARGATLLDDRSPPHDPLLEPSEVYTTTRPLYCSVCQGTIEPRERYMYAEFERGAKVSVHERCAKGEKG